MANQITVNSGSGNITVTTSRAVIGTVANVPTANYANFAGEVVDPSQPNITSVGNLTSLNVTGTTTTGNLVVLGNLQVGNLVANTANFANFAGEAFDVAGANVTGTVANATFATTAGSANTANSATVANSANSVAGANVSGTVANATYALNAGNANFANSATVASSANSVTLANVSGAGNIASINLDGNVANVLKGNGTFGPEGSTGNANYANFAGTAFSVSGSNVSGAVANATFALDAGNANIANTAYAVSGANVSGAVANATFALDAGNANIANSANSVTLANVSGAGNIAGINLDGNVSNLLTGNGTFVAIPTSTANANYANFAGNAFSVDGSNVVGAVANATFALDAGNANIANIAYSVSGANVSGAVANATFALDAGNANIANIAYSVSGSNVSGAVANATFALDAGNANIANIAYSVAAANVSGLGNIATINLDGSASNVLFGNGTFGPEGSTGNANYANFAGNAFSVDGSNVVGAVANATFALDAGNANIANVAYSVAAANVSGLGNIATINLDGNVSNLLTGNGTFVAIPTSVANANYANFAGTVLTNAQPNITSVGNLSALTVTGALTGNAITWSNLITYTGNTAASEKILVQADLAGAVAVRNLGFRAGNITNASASNTSAGGLQFLGGVAASTDAGNVFIARAGITTITSGIASTANGAAFSGNLTLSIGTASSNSANATSGVVTLSAGAAVAANGNAIIGNNFIGGGTATATNGNAFGGNINYSAANANSVTTGTAQGGNINLTAGFARSDNGNSTSGTITISTANATANVTAGTATVGSININTGTANGITANVRGNINIGNSGTANAVNIGAANTSVNVSGNVSITANSSASPLTVSNEGIGGISSYNMYNNTSVFTVQSFYRTRGNSATRTAVSTNDTIFTQNYSVYGDGGNTNVTVGYQENKVGTNYGNGQVSVVSTFAASYTGSSFNVSGYDNINLNGNVATPYDINVNSSNVIIGANGRLAYLRTFGSFTSNATQTSNGANTTNYMTLNNTEDANGISIASSTQITVARTGRYNIQFSAQLEKTDSGTDIIEIWLDKNGSSVANSATRLELAGNGAKAVAAWDFNVNAANVNDYFRLAWASPDTAVQLTAITSANTISGVAVPSLIVDVNPIGA